MADPSFLWTKTGLLSNRVGENDMDGKPIIVGQDARYARPWNSCIPFDQISKDNLPPFYVRLRDDQVGNLCNRVLTKRGVSTARKLGRYWPWDFNADGSISNTRTNWGPAYTWIVKPNFAKHDSLRGGKSLPEYIDPCLPLTYTSSDKIMMQGTSSDMQASRSSKKHGASDELEKDGGGSGATNKKRCTDLSGNETPKPKLPVDIVGNRSTPPITHDAITEALTHFDTLTSSVRESLHKLTDLEGKLEETSTNGAAAAKEIIELKSQLQAEKAQASACNETIRIQDAKVKDVETRLAKAKEMVRTREEALERKESQWDQAQEILDEAKTRLRGVATPALSVDGLGKRARGRKKKSVMKVLGEESEKT